MPSDQKPPPGEPATRVLRSFRRIFNAVKTHFRDVEKKTGVAGAQIWALSVVRDQPAIGMTGLARAMDIHQSTASNLVRSLTEKALIRVERDPADRRAVQLQVSPAGLRVLRRAPGPPKGVLPEALAALDKRTLARLERDLARLIDILGADEKAGGIPLGQAQ